MTRLARAFVALVPPDDVLDALQARLAPLAGEVRGLRWLPRPQWHVTLQFLGAVGDAEALVDALASAAVGLGPRTVRLRGAGAFPSPRRAAVLWVGVEERAPIAAVAGTVLAATAQLGHHVEDRPFHPHLTVARAARPRSVARLVEALADDPVGPAWTADRVTLEVSDTRPSGAVHTVWAEVPLGP